jgi:peptidoglycan/LPS O-acetylase OafA/YrhL
LAGSALTPSDQDHFRADIEGMRAVAILAVLLYHAGIPGITGGFTGVDVFFVISGFLITGLLMREIATTGRVNLPLFYARRARRLLPAALIVIALTVLASWFVLPSIDFPSVAGDGAAAALYVSNYRFALSATDYFAPEGTLSPLLHYWSLGVEEQFYLFWPLLLLLGVRLMGTRRLWWLMAAIAAVSFTASLVLTDLEPPWAFYSLLTRAWQLALGGLIALGLTKRLVLGRRLAMLAGALGMGLIVAAVLLINESDPYPGFRALAPAVGAALLIIAGQNSEVASSRVLGTRPMRWFGRISYSLYLWHWPLLILVPLAIGNDTLPVRVTLAVVAIGLAYVSTRVIETPFRFGRISRWAARRTLAVAGAASAAVAILCLATVGIAFGPQPRLGPTFAPFALTADGRPELPEPVLSGPVPADLTPSLAAARDDLARSLTDGCQVAFLGVKPRPCAYGDPNGRSTVYLIGDSHAAQWLPALESLASSRSWRVVPRTKGNCPPVDATVWLARYQRPYVECDEWRRNVLDEVAAVRPELVLVTFTRSAEMVDGSGRHAVSDDPDAWREAMERVLSELKANSAKVILLADTPRHPQDPVKCLATHPVVDACAAPRDALLDDAYAALEQTAAANVGIPLISASDWLCPDGHCPLIMGRYLVYRDTNHMTATFSALLSAALGSAIDTAPIPSLPAR